MEIKYKLWHNVAEPEIVIGWHNTRPVVGDTIRHKDKYFVVVERVFNLNNEEHTVVHCEEKEIDSLDRYK